MAIIAITPQVLAPGTVLEEALQVGRDVQLLIKRLILAMNHRRDGETVMFNGQTVTVHFRTWPRPGEDKVPRDPYLVIESAQRVEELNFGRPPSKGDIAWIFGVGSESGAVLVGRFVGIVKRLLGMLGASFAVVTAVVTFG